VHETVVGQVGDVRQVVEGAAVVQNVEVDDGVVGILF
jgi:hypothetical protein